MEQQETIIQNIRALSESERLDARQVARQNVIKALGKQPDRSMFKHYAVSRYPDWLHAIIVALSLLALLAAFTPSAIRLYHIGSQTFTLNAIDGAPTSDAESKVAVGISTVLLAETGQLIFSLALAVLGGMAGARRLLYASMGISTLIALIGNIQVALVGNWGNPFAWLEAIAPPVLVLSTAYVLKGLLLEVVERRHSNERAFQEALAVWKLGADDPEASSTWVQHYANALRDALRAKNRRYKTGRETLPGLTPDDWRAVVYRELAADEWYITPGRSATDRQGQTDRRSIIPARSDGRQTDKRTLVIRHLTDNPDDANLSVRELEAKLGNMAGRDTVHKALLEFRARMNGHEGADDERDHARTNPIAEERAENGM